MLMSFRLTFRIEIPSLVVQGDLKVRDIRIVSHSTASLVYVIIIANIECHTQLNGRAAAWSPNSTPLYYAPCTVSCLPLIHTHTHARARVHALPHTHPLARSLPVFLFPTDDLLRPGRA